MMSPSEVLMVSGWALAWMAARVSSAMKKYFIFFYKLNGVFRAIVHESGLRAFPGGPCGFETGTL